MKPKHTNKHKLIDTKYSFEIESQNRETINALFDEYEKKYTNVYFDIELDYGDCYYPGDNPNINIQWYGEPK